MGRRKIKKDSWLSLQTDWMFEDPIDYEHKKYIMLNFLKKCDNNLNDLKVYPTFIELSLHLANTQSLIKNNSIIYTEKELESPDDELMLMDLKYKIPPTIEQNSYDEIKKIIQFSAPKLFDYFNIAKSIWSFGFDSVGINIKKNKRYFKGSRGFVYYLDEFNKTDFVWEFLLKRISKQKTDSKIIFNLIYSGQTNELKLKQIIDNYKNVFSGLTEQEVSKLPIVEVSSKENLPFNETLVPIFKRKLLSYIMQTVKLQSIPN